MNPDPVGRLAAAGLDPHYVQRVVATALDEDLGAGGAAGGDVTSLATIAPGERASADLVARTPGVAAGLPVAEAVFAAVAGTDLAAEQHVDDGAAVGAGKALLTVTGPVRALLTAERTALNLACHLSGIATSTRQWVDAVAGTGARIRDTRKTTAGLRALEKYAVRCGGGVNHRMGLYDAALVKDNHVAAAGSLAAAFTAVRQRFPELPVEVECDTLDQVADALGAGADLILCDNMSVAELREAAALAGGRAALEASGGLTIDTAADVASTGVHYLAVGALTHSAPSLDIALDLHETPLTEK